MAFPRIPSGIQRAAIFAARFLSPAVLAASGVLIITALALFVPPFVGMADNGDYYRILYGNGIYFNQPDYDSRYLGYFVREYGIFQYFNEHQTLLYSSQSLLIRLALAVNKLIYSTTVFDIRIQAVLLTLMYTAAIYLLVEGMTCRMSRLKGYAVAAAAVFVFGDTAYTAYFNSFYGESVVLVMMVLLMASWLLFYRKRYNDYVLLALFAVSALILITVKQQNAPVGVVLAFAGVSLLFMRRARLFRFSAGGILALLFAAGIATYVWIPKDFVHINQYHAMTRGVLQTTDNPEKALQAFGMDKQYALLKGTIYYAPYAAVDVSGPELKKTFYGKYGFVSIAAYYAAHPNEMGTLLNVAARDAFTIRPEAMGSYEQSAGKGFGAQSRFFSAYSLLKQAAAPKTFGFIVIWMVFVTGLYTPGFVKAVQIRDMRHIQKLALVVAGMGIGLSGILVSIIGAGDADLAKHEFLFTLGFDLISVLAIADLMGGELGYRQAPDQPLEAPKPGALPPSIANKGVNV